MRQVQYWRLSDVHSVAKCWRMEERRYSSLEIEKIAKSSLSDTHDRLKICSFTTVEKKPGVTFHEMNFKLVWSDHYHYLGKVWVQWKTLVLLLCSNRPLHGVVKQGRGARQELLPMHSISISRSQASLSVLWLISYSTMDFERMTRASFSAWLISGSFTCLPISPVQRVIIDVQNRNNPCEFRLKLSILPTGEMSHVFVTPISHLATWSNKPVFQTRPFLLISISHWQNR